MKNREQEIYEKASKQAMVKFEDKKEKLFRNTPKQSSKKIDYSFRTSKSTNKVDAALKTDITENKIEPTSKNGISSKFKPDPVSEELMLKMDKIEPVEINSERFPKPSKHVIIEEKNNTEHDVDLAIEIQLDPMDDQDVRINNSNHSSSFIDTMSKNDLNLDNLYSQTLITELKNQIKYLEITANEKEEKFLAYITENEKIISENEKAIEQLQKTNDIWQQEYNKQLVQNKTFYEEFALLMDKKEKAIRDSFLNSTNDLEKKILHLEKVNSNLADEMNKINQMSASYCKECDLTIKRLNEQNSKLLMKYEELWKTYEIDFNNLTDLVKV